jgi:hypothetical protein
MLLKKLNLNKGNYLLAFSALNGLHTLLDYKKLKSKP